MLTVLRRLFAVLVFVLAPSCGEPQAGLEAQAKEIARELAGLGYEVDLECLSFDTRSWLEAGEDLCQEVKRRFPRSAREGRLRLLQALGWWQADTLEEYTEAMCRCGPSSAFLCYLPDSKTIIRLEGGGGPVTNSAAPDLVVAHELIHAWRDQQFDLDEHLASYRSFEQERIDKCLDEGEAEFVAVALAVVRSGKDPMKIAPEFFDSPPGVVASQISADLAYEHGGCFALRIFQRGGWEALRSIRDYRPASTEQILHPDKLEIDSPASVELPGWPSSAGESELVCEDCVGEMGIYSLLLTACGPSPWVDRDLDQLWIAATGWDGDRLQVYRTAAGEPAVIWRSLWDREEDAQQFARVIGEHGDGDLRVHGRVVDFVRTVEGPLADELLKSLARELVIPEENPADARTTAEAEAGWRAERNLDPLIEDGRWVHPKFEFSLPVYDGWVEYSAKEHSALGKMIDGNLAGAIIVHTRPNIGDRSLHALGERIRASAERLDVEIDKFEEREIDGHGLIWARSPSSDEKGECTTTITFTHGRVVVSLSVGVFEPYQDRLESEVDKILTGLRFGTNRYKPPGRGGAVSDLLLPAERKKCSIVVRDAATLRPLEGADVWAVSGGARRHGEAVEDQEEIARRRGRLFVTDRGGRVTLRTPLGGLWVYVRSGRLFGTTYLLDDLEGSTTLDLLPD